MIFSILSSEESVEKVVICQTSEVFDGVKNSKIRLKLDRIR